jgi:3-deoxy-D-manno-octulosonic-acid transferase
MGRHHETQLPAVEQLIARGAIRIVEDDADLEAALRRLLGDAGERSRLANAALDTAAGLRGATERTVRWLEGRRLWPVSR